MHARIQGEVDRGPDPPPLEKSQNIGVLNNTGPGPLKNDNTDLKVGV